MNEFFDSLGKLSGALNGRKLGRATFKLTRELKARSVYADVAARYDHETAEAAAAAVRAGRPYQGILERADRTRRERAEREALLKSPPPLHGSARWASAEELAGAVSDDFDHPSSILLGKVQDHSGRWRWLHWDEAGHLLTLAPTRTGKAYTTIIPNLLRYQGSCVVFDPKGELYAETSA